MNRFAIWFCSYLLLSPWGRPKENSFAHFPQITDQRELCHFTKFSQHVADNLFTTIMCSLAWRGWIVTRDIWLIAAFEQCGGSRLRLQPCSAPRGSQRPAAFSSLGDQFIFISFALMLRRSCYTAAPRWSREASQAAKSLIQGIQVNPNALPASIRIFVLTQSTSVSQDKFCSLFLATESISRYRKSPGE